ETGEDERQGLSRCHLSSLKRGDGLGGLSGAARAVPPDSPPASDASEEREGGDPFRRGLETAPELGPLQDLDVRAHHHPIVVRMTSRGTTVVLGERVLDVWLAAH